LGKIPIVIEKRSKKEKFISTGVYLLDAALSAKIVGWWNSVN
jgi:hypothetical protein